MGTTRRQPLAARPPSRKKGYLAGLAIIVVAGCVSFTSARAADETLTVNTMAQAIDALASRSGYVITLEEPRLVYEGDFDDMPKKFRRDLDRYPQGAAPRVLVPRENSLTLSIPSSPSATTQEIAADLKQLVERQSMSDHGAHFRVEQVGDVFHVVPTEVRDRNGNWTPQSSIFDLPISLPKQERSALDVVQAVCTAVGNNAHVPVKLLQAPMTMLHYSRNVLEASSEPAASVMTRALSGLNRRLNWRVAYFAPMNSYLLVISVIPDRPSSAANSQAAKGPPAVAGATPVGKSSAPSVALGSPPPK